MATEMVVFPVMLEGVHLRLEPLAKAHLAGLAEVGLDEELWRWIPVPVRTVDDMAAHLETALEEQKRGVSLPFAIVEKATGRAIGSTRYGNIDRTHHRVEIGWTWGSAQLAAHGHEYGSEVPSAEACIRNAGLHARGAKDGFAE